MITTARLFGSALANQLNTGAGNWARPLDLKEIEMEVKEALDLLKQVCAETQSNLKGHQTIQQALQVVEKAVEKVKHAPDDTKITEQTEKKEELTEGS